MKTIIPFLAVMIFAGCSQHTETKGVIYSGEANVNNRLRLFTATSPEVGKIIVLNMTGPRELTFHFNDKVSHLDYEKDVIIILSEAGEPEWKAKKVKGGFELEDGTVLQYDNCRDWTICLIDADTQQPVLKGRYALNGSRTMITLWISESEKHAELLGLVANGLFNRSKNEKLLIESALETLSQQVWTY